jgi:mono/diheme cytochrome c family protein
MAFDGGAARFGRRKNRQAALTRRVGRKCRLRQTDEPLKPMERTMKRTLVAVIAMLAAVAWTANATDAKALYEKECAKCHGSDGKGDTKMGKKLGAKDYTDPKVQDALTDDAAFKAIKEGLKDKDGKTLMKPAEGMSDDDIKALVKYMRSFKKQ